ncbi:MAG: CarD family transcriptional regulator [Anaerolineales bacterium]
MPFKIDDLVIHPAHGMGLITGLVMKRVLEAEARLYYEIAIQRSVVWAPVDDSKANQLRPLTPKKELDHYRDVLRSSPTPLIPDSRQRQLGLRGRLKSGAFQDTCEVVRDLTARGWHKPLNEADGLMLRNTRAGLCQEWAAADGVSVLQATDEVEALLREARQAYQA